MNKQIQNFSFNHPINFVEGQKWVLAVTSFSTINSVFHITNENNSFSITIPVHWNFKSAPKTFDELNKLLEFRPGNDIELHVE